MPKTFNIITLGCKVNQCESAHISQVLADAGWRSVEHGGKADVTVVNTCIVTRAAAHQSRQAVRKAIRGNPAGRVAAIGCYGQVFPEELLDIEGLEMVVGNAAKGRVAEVILHDDPTEPCIVRAESFDREPPFDRMPIRRFPGRARAFVKIQDGCESFCSYCIVPYARGPCRSLPVREVMSTLESLVRSGYREAVITGIHLGKYGVDLPGDADLVSLLWEIGRAGLPMRIRLSSLEPNEIGEGLIRMAAEETWLCPHFHIPLQSGNDGVLKKMNRTYGAHEFARLVERIHDEIPHAAIGADVMCGFPGESEAAHRDTVSLVEGLPLSYLHVFPYSRRKGTPASGFDAQLADEIIKQRAAEMRAVGRRKRAAFYERCLGKCFSVVAEGRDPENPSRVKGTSDNYLSVRVKAESDAMNRLLDVRMVRVVGGVMEGILC